MKIALVTSPFGTLPPQGIGAVEKLWYNVGLAFAKDQHEVAFYCKRSRNDHPAIPKVEFCYARGYDRTGRLSSDLVLDFIYSFRTLARLKPCDVLVMNTFFMPLLCPLFRHKFKVAIYNVARQPKGQLRFYGCVDRFSCVSHAVAAAAAAQAPKLADRVKVIHNPVDTNAFCRMPEHEADTQDNAPNMKDTGSAREDGKPHVIGYSGRIHPEKGLGLLVQACALLRSKGYRVHLRLIGPRSVAQGGGGDNYTASLDQLAGDHPIEWIDPVSDAAKLAAELRKCDIFCYPSVAERGETFGVAPLEAMAVGCATVVSALECFQDFVEDGVTGLVFDHRSGNPAEALADKIEHLLVHSDIRAKISHEGARVAHEQFSTERIAQEYLTDFNQLLALKRKA